MITDIDHFDDDVLWELKVTFYADDEWILKNIDPRFGAAVEARVQHLREKYPNEDIRIRWDH
ncbi:hypothetical protein [Streptomyces sp. NPDC001816]|uniref:hypothetical protein n=1 Tax=Streptomyces sp. NPDC001816 TaxID=3364612 RepID=UPI0036AB2FE5